MSKLVGLLVQFAVGQHAVGRLHRHVVWIPARDIFKIRPPGNVPVGADGLNALDAVISNVWYPPDESHQLNKKFETADRLRILHNRFFFINIFSFTYHE